MTTLTTHLKPVPTMYQTLLLWSPAGTSRLVLPGVACHDARPEKSGYQIFANTNRPIVSPPPRRE